MENKTIFRSNSIKKEFLFLSFLLFSTIFVFGCSTTAESTQDEENSYSYKSDEGKTTFNFTTKDDSETSHWKAFFKDDELVSLYKNDEKIPDEELENYEDMVYDKLDELRPHKKEITVHIDNFPFDKEEFKEKMQDLKKYFKNHKHEWNFDNEEFKEQMDKLKEELEKLKDHKIHIEIDKEALKESMRELRKSLKELENNPPKIHIDLDKLHENLQKMKKELKQQKWVTKDFNVHIPNIDINIPPVPDINIPEINVDIPDINIDIPEIDLSGLEESMKELNKEMEKLNNFIKDLKSEMVKDGLLNDDDEDARIEIDKDEMRVNDVKVPDNLFEKYKKMYKEHFGKDLEDDNHFNIN